MIAIIGGGISGLTLAYQLQKNNRAYILLESNSFLGGCIQTSKVDKVIAEKGPNSILATDFIIEFLNELHLSDQIVVANSIIKNRYVFKSGKYRELPSNPLNLLTSSFFSFSQRIKIIKEFADKTPLIKDTTLYELIKSRFGAEVADYVLDPFVSGIYAGNSKELIAELCFPVLTNNVETYGSVLKGFIKNPPKRKTTITFKNGLSELIDALSNRLDNVKCNSNVLGIHKKGKQWDLSVDSENGIETISCDTVVMAIPTYRASKIIKPHYPEFSAALSKVEYPMVRYAHILFNRSQMGFAALGFGGLHPSVEPLLTAGIIWNSSVFEGRTPADQMLLTCMMNEKRTPNLRMMADAEIYEILIQEIKTLYKISGEPISISMGGWEHAIPQYDIHMKQVKTEVDSLVPDGIHFLSNWPNGIGISDCIQNAFGLASKI